MSSGKCWRCIAHTSDIAKIKNSYRLTYSSYTSQQSTISFSTSTARLANPTSKGRSLNLRDGPPKRGARTTFTTKRKQRNETKGRPPAPGERKALRKRIVLSNTNALEVPGMQDLSAESMVDPNLQGRVIGISGPVLDQLRAMEAFKVSQGWGLFRRPGMLMRTETMEQAKQFKKMSKEGNQDTLRKVLVGERGSGKSTLLLQAMTMAFLKKWVVINIPEGQDLSMGHTEYGPAPGTFPTLYNQKVYTASLLMRIARANPVLSTLQISREHATLPIPLQANISLDRLALLGASDPDVAHPIFQALWTELTSQSTAEHRRPKLLITLDGLGHVSKNSAYMSATFKPIHAHELTVVDWFMSCLSGTQSLPNGGMVLAATSGSNQPTVPTLRFKLSELEAQQNPSLLVGQESPIQPFLTATSQQHNPMPQRKSFFKYDERVMECFTKGLEVQCLKGVSREEARALMEYWAKSGMMRSVVSEELVGEKWTISGGGVIGELERGCVRMRV